MSGSRAIVLTLSVRDADIVRQQLVAMGEQGERALARLDAAAQRTAQGNGGVAAYSAATRVANDNTRNWGNVLGQAGFQVQDFAVQVQAGTSALTALSQQGSQLLGVFGTGGAIAGAALTVGILAYQIFGAKDATEDLAKAQEELQRAMGRTIEFMETAAERARRLAAEQRDAAQAGLVAGQRTADNELTEARRRLAALEADRARLIDANRNLPGFDQATVLRDQIARAQADVARAELEAEALRQRRGNLITAPSGADRDEAEQLRRGIDDRYRIEEEYQERVRALRRQSAILGAQEVERLEVEARRKRDEALERLDRQPAGRAPRAERPERPFLDTQAAVATSLGNLTDQFDAYNQQINLQNAGLDRANTILAEYARQQDLLTALLDAGIISEQQFGEEVERSTLRLGQQLDALQQRGQRTDQIGRDLGMTFSSAFEDAVVKGEDLSKVLKSLEQDIARLILRATVTRPLASALEGVGSRLGSALGSLFGGGSTGQAAELDGVFATGGIMTPDGPMPLRRYASGGIADSPQVALFGEADMPEAYVPLPDGRAIPVRMEGEAGGGGVAFSITNNIDARGADPSMIPRLRAEMDAVAKANLAQFADRMNRGGSVSRLVGRRG